MALFSWHASGESGVDGQSLRGTSASDRKGDFGGDMHGGTAVFTIIAKNYLPCARVLMRSAAEHHPDWSRFVVLVDQVDGHFHPREEGFEMVLSSDLPIPHSRWFHFKYTLMEL